MSDTKANFSIGEIIRHIRFEYRGVIIDVDPMFSGTDEWYEAVAKSRPPKDKPWYHVLVHKSDVQTYVAERNLEADETGDPIDHLMIDEFFSEFTGGVYHAKHSAN